MTTKHTTRTDDLLPAFPGRPYSYSPGERVDEYQIPQDAVRQYLDGKYLPLTGGTLTGALSGTTAAFSGDVDANDFVLTGSSGGTGGVGGTGGPVAVSDEGTVLTAEVTSLNFVGSGVVASASGHDITVTVDTYTRAASDGKYLPFSGGTITGALQVNSTFTAQGAMALGGQLTAYCAAGNEAIIWAASGRSGDNQALFRASYNGLLQWGPGGTTSPDTNLYRQSAGLLATDSNFSGGGTATFVSNATAQDFILAGSAGGSAGSAQLVAVFDHGTLLTSQASSLDFTGTGVSSSVSNGAVTVNVDSYTRAQSDGKYLPFAGGTITGALLSSKLLQTSGMMRATGWTTGSESGPAAEIGYTGGAAYVFGFDRTAATDIPLHVRGSAILFDLAGAVVGSFQNSMFSSTYPLRSTASGGWTMGNVAGNQRMYYDSVNVKFVLLSGSDSLAALNTGDLLVARGATQGCIYFGTNGDVWLYRSAVNLLDIHNLHLNFNDTYGIRSTSGNTFYSNAPFWVNQSSAASPGGIRFTDTSNNIKGYVYWDTGGFGLLNDQGGWALRCAYGAGYGGTLYGAWTTSSNHYAADFVLS